MLFRGIAVHGSSANSMGSLRPFLAVHTHYVYANYVLQRHQYANERLTSSGNFSAGWRWVQYGGCLMC